MSARMAAQQVLQRIRPRAPIQRPTCTATHEDHHGRKTSTTTSPLASPTMPSAAIKTAMRRPSLVACVLIWAIRLRRYLVVNQTHSRRDESTAIHLSRRSTHRLAVTVVSMHSMGRRTTSGEMQSRVATVASLVLDIRRIAVYHLGVHRSAVHHLAVRRAVRRAVHRIAVAVVKACRRKMSGKMKSWVVTAAYLVLDTRRIARAAARDILVAAGVKKLVVDRV
jgi:CO/xanthine dehydrogenase Mo-binding subunit